MITLALLALVASVLVWAAPSSQAQSNSAPFADAGPDQTVAPRLPTTSDADATVTLTGNGSFDVDGATPPTGTTDCPGCSFKWEIQTGPYDWIALSDSTAVGPTFGVPTLAYVNTVSDNDPQKYEIVVQLTVTDNKGATDSDTVSIFLNRPPTADIQLFAGLRDPNVVDPEATTSERYSIPGVIDGPGENGNRDNEWDVAEGAYLALDASGSTDLENSSGMPNTYAWAQTSVRISAPPGATAGSATADFSGDQAATADNPSTLVVGAVTPAAGSPSVDDGVTLLPNDLVPGETATLFYTLTVNDGGNTASPGGLSGTSLIKIVVHDTSVPPVVEIEAGLSTTSENRGDAKPQATVGQITGVDNQFLVAAGSTVQLTAKVTDRDQPAPTGGISGHRYRWTGASQLEDDTTNTATVDERSMATVRVPAGAEDGDTIEVSVTVTDNSRNAVVVPIQLLVGTNTVPTAGGIQSDSTLNIPDGQGGIADRLSVVTYNDGFQNLKDGSTVTLRGVGNDADGDPLIHAWVQREAPDPAAFETAIAAWVADPTDTAVYAVAGGALADLKEPKRPLLSLEGALSDTVSFNVPELKVGDGVKGTILIFTVIDSKGVSASQLLYVRVTEDDDAPKAEAGPGQQVDPGSFVRLNGSASSDADVGDTLAYRWEYAGAEMDPLPDDRSPLSAAEINELDGWILRKDATAEGGFVYIVNAQGGFVADATTKEGTPQNAGDNLKSANDAYPYFDAPDLTGFNNIKLTFKLTVTDSADDTRFEVNGNLIDPATGEAYDPSGTDPEDPVAAESDTDMVTITVVNRYFSGNVTGPDFCVGPSLGGPSTYPFDSDGDGVADTCSLNTTRRATVARQNALETLANLNPIEFRDAVNAECNAPGFKQRDFGDDPADLETDVCETQRVTPPPAAADPATAEEFFSGIITGPDFCTNHSLGGARTYAHDSDGDGVADQCSLSTTKREAVARQTALETFIVSISAADLTKLTEQQRLVELEDMGADVVSGSNEESERNALRAKYGDGRTDDGAAALTTDERNTIDASIDALSPVKANADRYSNAVDAACRALGSQDFGDAASALARDACAPKPGQTGDALPSS